jgi:hypothetical protein
MVTIVPVPGAESVQDLRFQGANNRRWVLGLKSDRPRPMDCYWEEPYSLELNEAGVMASTANWRCIMINEFHEVFVNVYANMEVKWVGGVMTNWTFKRRRGSADVARNERVEGLRFLFEGDPDPVGASGAQFTTLLPRDAWLETYFHLPVE